MLSRLSGHTNYVYSCCFLSESLVVTGSNDKTLKVWDLATQAERHTIAEHTEAVYALDVHPSLQFFASGSADGTVRVWRSVDYSLVTTIPCGNRVDALRFALQPDALVVATKGQRTRCFNFLTGECTVTHAFAYTNAQFVFGCAVSGPMPGMHVCLHALNHTSHHTSVGLPRV